MTRLERATDITRKLRVELSRVVEKYGPTQVQIMLTVEDFRTLHWASKEYGVEVGVDSPFNVKDMTLFGLPYAISDVTRVRTL